MQNALAFTCTSINGDIPAGGSVTPVDTYVNIGELIEGNQNSVLDVSQISCTGMKSIEVTDYLKTSYMPSVFSKKIFPDVHSGLIINGVKYYAPISAGIKIISVKSTMDNTETKQVNIQAFIEISDKPSKYVNIHAGDVLGELYFEQTNSLPGCPQCGPYNWKLLAKNSYNFITNTCSINNGQQINIDFNEVNRTILNANIFGNQPSVNQQINAHCKSPVTQDIMIRLVSDNTSFSPNLIKTSNENIGIAMLHNNKLINPGMEIRTHLTQGNSTDNVSFKLVKKNIPSTSIATGAFTGSATLIIGVP